MQWSTLKRPLPHAKLPCQARFSHGTPPSAFRLIGASQQRATRRYKMSLVLVARRADTLPRKLTDSQLPVLFVRLIGHQ